MVNIPNQISAITLFVNDIDRAKSFYQLAFDLPVYYEDSDSVVFKFESTLINLLKDTQASGLLAPILVVPNSQGQQVLLTVTVIDVDAEYERLISKGIKVVSGPIDQPWGIRTLIFTDPDGHCWELAHKI